MKLSNTKLAILALIAANIIWGAGLPIYKWTLEIIPVYTFTFLRFFTGALIILPFAFRSFRFQTRDLLKIILLGLLSVTIQIPLLFLGLKLSPSINAPIIISSGPIILIVFAIIFLKEKISQKLIIGTLISLGGVLLLVFKPEIFNGNFNTTLGSFFIFSATVCSVFQAILLKKIMKRNDIATIMFLTFMIGSIPLLPLVFSELNTFNFGLINFQAIFGLTYGIVLASVISHFLFFFGIKYLDVSNVGIFAYVDPIATILVAVPLLHETISPTYAIAAFLVFGGIFIAEGRIHYHPFHKLLS